MGYFRIMMSVRGQIAALGKQIFSSETNDIAELKTMTKQLLDKLEIEPFSKKS